MAGVAITLLAVAGDAAPTAKETWGKESNGLVASLHAKKTQFVPGEAMAFELAVKNVSDKARTLTRGGSQTGWTLQFGDWNWEVTSARGLQMYVPLVLKPGESKILALGAGGTYRSIGSEGWNFVWQGPQKRPVASRDALPPGSYRVTAMYADDALPTGTGGLQTGPIEIQITPALP